MTIATEPQPADLETDSNPSTATEMAGHGSVALAGVRRFASWAWKPAGLWLAARLCIATIWTVVESYRWGAGIWDSVWYHDVATNGYTPVTPETIPDVGSNIVFFPAYPMLSGFVSDVTGLDAFWSLQAVAWFTGLVATIMLFAFTRELYGEKRALLTTVFFSFSTGAFALSMLYSEGLFLIAAIGCCWLLMRERYLAAGTFAMLGTATRPTGVVLIAVCAAAVLLAKPEHRVKAIAATVMASVGIGGYFVFLRTLTGSWSTYFEAQRIGWGDYTHPIEGRAGELRALIDWDFVSPGMLMVAALSLFGFGTVVAGIRHLVHNRAHPLLIVYSAAMTVMLWCSVMVGFRPRMIMVIFPVFMALSGIMKTDRRVLAWMVVTIAVGAAVIRIYLTGYYLIP